MTKQYLLLPNKILAIIFLLSACVASAQQISNCPASPYPINVKQADGSVLTIVGKGGMLRSWTETADGYSIVKKNGIYEYAAKVNGKLVASGVPAKNVKERRSSEKIFLQKISRFISPDVPAFSGNPALNSSMPNTSGPALVGYQPAGNFKVLLILIKYPDLPNTYTPTNFNNLMNQANYRGTGSFKDFYSACSFGQLNLTTDVFGWYTASHTSSYYGYSNGFVRSTELVREAVNAAEAAGVNFAQYDNDHDGVADGIIVAHAGPGAEEGSRGQYIWSHRWVLSAGGNQVTYDGTLINDYMINPETRTYTADMVGRGVYCHEFGHDLGLPDLYDIDGGSEGIGEWSLMASAGWLGNEHTPGNMDAWCRNQLGWVNPVVLSSGGAYSLNAANASSQVFRINTPLSNEYFLLENRQKSGLDIALKGSGLAIFHINSNQTSNADENLKLVDLEEADGLNDLDNQVNRGDAGDLYPGSSNKTVFNNSSNPNSKTYTNVNTNISISNIAIDGTGKALFNFSLGSSAAPVVSITSPADNSAYTAPATINISASATAATGATITNVQFYNGVTLLNTDNTAPYTYSWTNVPQGNYSITAKATDNNGLVTTSSAVHVSVNANGSLEAEDAVLSGPVVAANQPGFTGSGFADYINASNDFIEWTVNDSAAGQFLLQFRYANGGSANRPLQLKVNGVVVNGALAFSPTGSFATWSVSSATANLLAGTNKIRLTATGLSGPNVDNLRVDAASCQSGTLEAEQAVLSGAVVASNQPGFTGSGFADYIHASADYVEWTINAALTGPTSLQFRYANGGVADRPLKLEVNGLVVNPGLAFSPTGSFSAWSFSSVTANLTAGINKIRLTATGSSGPNIDYLAFSCNNPSPLVQNALPVKNLSGASTAFLSAHVTPNPASGNATLILSSSLKLPVNLQLVDMLGRTQRVTRIIPGGDGTYNFPVSDLHKGSYIIILKQGSLTAHTRLVVAGK